MTAPEVRIFADAGALADALARRLLDDVSRALEAKPRPAFCLTGGSTAGALYERLAAAPGGPAWKRVHFFWGDERFVPRGDPDSNHRLAWDAWLKPLGVPAENLHPVATEASDPRASAAAYERELRSFFPGAPAFDVLLLGVGEDGHVASLFPGSREAEERDRWVVGVEDSPKPPPRRVSLTLPAINAASRVHFLAAGGAKAEAVAGALEGRPDLPAGRVRPAAGTVSWWLDRAAARHIK